MEGRIVFEGFQEIPDGAELVEKFALHAAKISTRVTIAKKDTKMTAIRVFSFMTPSWGQLGFL
jgi:hypothetical protein